MKVSTFIETVDTYDDIIKFKSDKKRLEIEKKITKETLRVVGKASEIPSQNEINAFF